MTPYDKWNQCSKDWIDSTVRSVNPHVQSVGKTQTEDMLFELGRHVTPETCAKLLHGVQGAFATVCAL